MWEAGGGWQSWSMVEHKFGAQRYRQSHCLAGCRLDANTLELFKVDLARYANSEAPYLTLAKMLKNH